MAEGPDFDDAFNGQTIVLYDVSNNDFPSVRVISDYVGATKTATIDSAADFTVVTGDGARVFATAPGSTAPTAAQVADAVWDEDVESAHGTAGSWLGDLGDGEMVCR